MGAQYGQRSTLSANDQDLRINIEDMIHDYPDWQFPILKRLDSKVFTDEVKSHKYEWSLRDLRPTKAKVASASVANNDTQFYVDTPGVFNKDDVILMPDGVEQAVVTAVSGGTLVTVQRGWAGTAGTASLGETVKRIGVASPQGALADNMVTGTPTDFYNFTQIFEDVVELSDTDHKALIRGQEGSARLLSRKQKELMEMLQNTLLMGKRAMDKQNKRYTMAGIKDMIDTYAPSNVVDFGGASTWNTDSAVIDKLDDAIDIIANKMGGNPTIYMGYKALRKFKKIDGALQKTDRNDKKRGTAIPQTYISQIGDLDIVQIRERTGLLDNLIFLVDESDIGFKAMRQRGWFSRELPFAGDGHLWQIVGEYIFKMEHPDLHVYIKNLGL